MGTHIYNLQIRVLTYPEGGKIVAHALEMDILAYGDTEEKAIRELVELVDSQLLFAHQKREENLLLQKAPEEFFKRWDTAQEAALRSKLLGDKPGQLDVKAMMIPLSEKISKNPNKRFRRVADPACA